MGKNWAIAIGVNNYDNLQPLKYAQRDAEVMATWFREETRFDQVFLFTENSPPIPANPPIPTQPTAARFRRFLNAQFEKPLLNPEDNLWFFFAGHGKRYNDQDYLMFPDSDPTDSTTAISVDFITQRLRRCGAENVVLLLDACRDEGSRGGLGIGEEEHQGVITFYSCAANQQSWEIDELQHGAFTHALLEGLKLQGELNCATVERLDQYLRLNVPKINSNHKKPIQNPYLKAEPPYKMYFILLKQAARLQDVILLKYQASQAENRGDLSLARQLWKRVIAAVGYDVEAFDAIERIAVRINRGEGVVIDNASNNSGQDARTTEIISEKEKIKSEIDNYKASLPRSRATFFDKRFSKSFPGVRGIEKFGSPREAIMRLSKLLEEPLTLKSKNFKDNPIWWFRGNTNSPIIKFEHLENDIILINSAELKINKVIAVNPGSYYQSFIYIETYPMLPSGLYNFSEQDIQRQIQSLGYSCEEFGVYQRKFLIKRSEYDDGAAIIDGKIVELEKRFTESRVRYLSPYNLVITSTQNPLSNPSFDRGFEEIMNNILKVNASIEDLSQAVLKLPRHYLSM